MRTDLQEGWMPIGVTPQTDDPQVEWCRLGGIRLTEPFFEQTVSRALRDPARLLFRRKTSIAELESRQIVEDVPPPRGFIFHVSRCGSTLLAQMLAALPQNHVVSEAPPLDQLFETIRPEESVTNQQRVAWLRGMLLALGRRDADGEYNYFIKFDSWHVLELPLILQAFPDVPWIFLYRDPIEVMVSHRRQRGAQMVPGIVDSRLFNVEPSAALAMGPDEYCARVLARIYTAGLAHLQLGRGRLVNFSELPGAMWESLGKFFGVEWTSRDLERMRNASLQNAKSPAFSHSGDSEAKQLEASPELRRLAANWLQAPYALLEESRLAQAGVSSVSARAASARSSARSQSFTTQSITR